MKILFDNGTLNPIARILAGDEVPLRGGLAGTSWKTAN